MRLRPRAFLAFAALLGGTLVLAGAGTGASTSSRSVLYGINEFLGRQMIAPIEAKGIDVERLRVQ